MLEGASNGSVFQLSELVADAFAPTFCVTQKQLVGQSEMSAAPVRVTALSCTLVTRNGRDRS